MTKILKYITTPVLLLCLGFTSTQARWATKEDANLEVEYFNADVKVNSDGTSEEVVEFKDKILNEAGRDIAGVKTLTFTPDMSNLEVLEAKTIASDGTEYKVNISELETKPLASAPEGFDQAYQTLVVFPNANIGSSVYLKYKETLHTTPIKGVYSNGLYFGWGLNYWKNAHVNLKTDLPLNFKVNDKDNNLDIKKTSTNKEFTTDYTITLKQPVIYGIVNEAGSSILPHDKKLWAQVSTEDTYANIGKKEAREYEKVLQQKLPKRFEKIKEKAKKNSKFEDMLNTITSELSQDIRYMGDWRSIAGKFAPRDLETVAATGYGDCKDYATVTAAILRNLGYEANASLVRRGDVYIPNQVSTLPSIGDFNHAIVNVRGKNFGDKWIDPTNFVSMAHGMFPDIANRPSLVLDSKKPRYEHIPGVDPEHSKIKHTYRINFGDDSKLNYNTKVRFFGEQAMMPTGAELMFSPEIIKEEVLNTVAKTRNTENREVKLPDLTSVIVRDLELRMKWTSNNQLTKTNYGLAQNFTEKGLNFDEIDKNNQVGLIWLGSPHTFSRTTYLKNRKAGDLEKLNFAIDSPWIKAGRECSQREKDIKVVEFFQLKKNFIRPEEMDKESFNALQKVSKDYRDVYLISTQKYK